MKTCTKCKQDKPLDQFHRQKGGPQGRHSWCKDCFKANHNRKKASPEVKRRWNYQKRYGLTTEQVVQMVADQGGGCALCGKNVSQRPIVDHNHKTGKVRGILCHRCNIALWGVEDDTFHVKALDYLEEHLC